MLTNANLSLVTGGEGKSKYFLAHDPILLQDLERSHPHIVLQLPFRAIQGMGLVSHGSADLVEDLVYRMGASQARDVCEELAQRHFRRMQLTYYECAKFFLKANWR